MKKITVLLCDDHTIVREGVRGLLAATDDIHVVGEAENGNQSVKETTRLQPDVVVLDLAMPSLDGLKATRRILNKISSAKVLIFSASNNDQHMQQAVHAGAVGYVNKAAAPSDLLQAIRQVAQGDAFFSPAITKVLFKQWQSPAGTKTTTLTSREAEVLRLVADGNANKQIAGLLSISIKTVEKHRQTLMGKLDIHDIATLTRYAISNGFIESSRAPDRFTAESASPVDATRNFDWPGSPAPS